MTASGSKSSASSYPDPIIVPPVSGTHTSTLILLHGRGSNAHIFSGPLLSVPVPASNLTLPQLLPRTRFVFPTSSFRRATFANRSRITQWYDSFRLDQLDERPEVAVPGLSESVRYLHDLMEAEAAMVGGAGHVVIGGLSQGSSTAVNAYLTWTGDENVGAVVGLAGWLPMRQYMVDAMGLEDTRREEVEDKNSWGVVFEDCFDTTAGHDVTPAGLAVKSLREEFGLEMATASTTAGVLKTPIFLGHGTLDKKVPVHLGRQTAECLQAMRCDVTWREYDDLEHWYHGEELADVVQFLRRKCPSVHVKEP